MSDKVQHLTAGGVACLRRPGPGPAMLLLHGIGSASTSFLPLIRALGDEPDIIAWDMPGYGGSAPPVPEWPSADDYTEALGRLVEALSLPRCVVVGHSLGVMIAMRFARHHADRVAALVALSPALGYGVAPGSALPPGVLARIEDLDRLGPLGMAEARAHRLVHQPETKPEVLAAVRDAMGRVRPEGYRRASRMLAGADVLADAAAVQVPCLLAVGAEDVVTPPANARRLAETLGRGGAGQVRFEMIAGAGHALPQENPAAVATILRSFCLQAAPVPGTG